MAKKISVPTTDVLPETTSADQLSAYKQMDPELQSLSDELLLEEQKVTELDLNMFYQQCRTLYLVTQEKEKFTDEGAELLRRRHLWAKDTMRDRLSVGERITEKNLKEIQDLNAQLKGIGRSTFSRSHLVRLARLSDADARGMMLERFVKEGLTANDFGEAVTALIQSDPKVGAAKTQRKMRATSVVQNVDKAASKLLNELVPLGSDEFMSRLGQGSRADIENSLQAVRDGKVRLEMISEELVERITTLVSAEEILSLKLEQIAAATEKDASTEAEDAPVDAKSGGMADQFAKATRKLAAAAKQAKAEGQARASTPPPSAPAKKVASKEPGPPTAQKVKRKVRVKKSPTATKTK